MTNLSNMTDPVMITGYDPNSGTITETDAQGNTTTSNSGPQISTGSSSNPTQNLPAPSNPLSNPPPTTQTATQQADAQAYTDATSQITAALGSLGLGAMSSWATALAYTLSGQGVDASDIVSTIEQGLNNPVDGNGQVDQTALAAFNAALPGFNQRITNTGNNGSPGSSPVGAIANYLNYQTQIQQFSTQAGLLPGTISNVTGGNLWANNVSSSEVSQRITDATVATTSAPQQVQDYLANNFGMSPAALTSYYLNPTNTLQTIQSNMNSAMVGGEAAISGFSPSLSVAQSSALGAFLANGASSANGGQVGQIGTVTQQQANNAFTANLGGQITGSISQLATLENATPGQNAGSTVTENQLLSALGVPGEGTTQSQALVGVSNAQQTRTASARGGGGAAATAEGAVGLGFAQS